MNIQQAMARYFDGIDPLCTLEELKRAQLEGFLEAIQINDGDKPQYAIWFNIGCDGGFHVNAACQLCENPVGLNSMVAAVEDLARSRGAKYVRFNSSRVGLIARTQELGYEPIATCMRKTL